MNNARSTKNFKLFHHTSGSGEPLLLISGLNADHSFWNLCLAFLAQHFFVISCDNRGVGKSKLFTPACTTELMAEDLIHLLDDLGLDQVNIVGHSLGGCIAQQLALKHAHRIKKLVLCSSQAKMTTLRRMQLEANLEIMRADIPREIIVKHVLSTIFSNQFLSKPYIINALIQQSLAKPFEESRQSYFYQVEALFKHDTSAQLHQITVPTLVIGGAEDLLTPVASLKTLTMNIPQAREIIVPDIGHMLPIEAPALFCEYVFQFLCQ